MEKARISCIPYNYFHSISNSGGKKSEKKRANEASTFPGFMCHDDSWQSAVSDVCQRSFADRYRGGFPG